MSQLLLASRTATWKLNVVSFHSSLFGQMSSTQVQSMAVHFPIKLSQPDVQFDVVFPDETTYENFQLFVRNHQQQASNSTQLVTLNWPQRNITNWTGFIRAFERGGKRWNVMPRGSFVVDLVDSFVSSRTYQGSMSSNWTTIVGMGLPGLSLINPPTPAEITNFLNNPQFTGSTQPGQAPAAVGPGSTSAPVSNNPGMTLAGQFPSVVTGILPGSG